MKSSGSDYIHRYIARLAEGALFTTRDVLHSIKRNLVDQTLCRLNKKGTITRVGHGVYRKPTSKPSPLPSPQEVATVKAQAWGKRITKSGLDAAAELGLVEKGEDENVFLTSGCTTSFKSIVGRIKFRKAAPKKVLLGDKKIATYVKALCHMGKEYCDSPAVVNKLFEPVWQNVFEREELITFAAIIPSWFRDKLPIERYFAALHWERMKCTPMDRLTKTAQFLPAMLRDNEPNQDNYSKPVLYQL